MKKFKRTNTTELGQKDKPVLAPVKGNDFSLLKALPSVSMPLADLSLESMLRNTYHSSTLGATNLFEVIIPSMSQVEEVEIF